MNNNPIFISKHGFLPLLLLLFYVLCPPPLSSAQSTPERYDPYASATFSPSMAIIIVVLIAALFIMGFFSIYIRHRNSDSSGSAVRPVNGRSRRAAARGLDRAVIETFPTLVYSEVKVLKIGKGALECAVCLCEFEDDETLRLIPKCDHVFHPECIDAWLSSHTTCPVCRANLSPQPGESAPQLGGSGTESSVRELDIEAQNGAIESESDDDVERTDRETQARQQPPPPPEPQVIEVMSQRLNRNRTRGSRSNRPRNFSRSHSTGHSLVQPGENTERFTLRLPVDVRKQVMNRELNRANSLVVLPRESSSRRGYRTGGGGGGEGSSRGKTVRWLERMDRSFKSDLWGFSIAPPFFSRASSLRSPKVAASVDNNQPPPAPPAGPENSLGEPGRPPV